MSQTNLVEIVNLPINDEGSFRVLQLNIGDVNYLVFGNPPREMPHPLILEQFLTSRNIAFLTIKSKLYRDADIPSPIGLNNNYLLTGAWYCDIATIDKRFRGLNSDSSHYRLSIDREIAKLVRDKFVELGFSDLSIDGMAKY